MRSQDGDAASVAVRNVGGIDACRVTLTPGVTVLAGANATNRTSFLRALSDVLGGTAGRLKDGADDGAVELSLGGESYSVEYERTATGVERTGTPYAADATLVDTFVSLLADNPARQAAVAGTLRDVIMAPLDTADVETRIESLAEERADVEARLTELDRKLDRLPGLRDRRETLEAELADLDADVDATREAIEAFRADEDVAERAERTLDDLEAERERQRRLRDKRAVQRRTVEALEAERADIEAELRDLAVDESRLETVEATIDQLQARERSLAETIEELTAVVEFNADRLAADSMPGADMTASDDAVDTKAGGVEGGETGEGTAGAEGDRPAEPVTCWTCGSTVERERIADRIAELRSLASEKRDERATVENRLESLRDERDDLTAKADRRDSLHRRKAEIERDLRQREARIEDIESRLESVTGDVERLEARLEDTGVDGDGVVDRYRELTELEYRRGQLEAELADVTDEIETLEELADEREELAARRDEVVDDLERLRGRVDETERAAVDTFNERMAELLDRLDYDRVSRIWVERDAADDRASSFTLHVVRRGDDGRVYDGTVASLSESEREVVGLVVALAGYLVHDVHDTVPFLLLDSVEAIDADRIARLVSYLAADVTYLVVALLPEDARALPETCDRIPAADLGS